jgi:hypothetical protein
MTKAAKSSTFFIFCKNSATKNQPTCLAALETGCKNLIDKIPKKSSEWLNQYNPLNPPKADRQADINGDSLANFTDYAGLLNN